MKKSRQMLASLGFMLAAAAGAQGASTASTPAQVIAAASAAPEGVETAVEMSIGSTGAVGYQVYLNSAADYRDPANLTVELFPTPRAKLKERVGAEPEDVMKGRRIRVTGIAKRIAIPRRDGTTGHQTRIAINRIEQLQLLD